jgi:HKD family nuclease
MFLPYAGKRKRTLADVLIRELAKGGWTSFRAAIAFARQSGEEGSDYDAIRTLLEELSEFPNARMSLYNERSRTFHPKFYLFASERTALLIIGSSNWSHGGLENNVEANVLLHLDFSDAEQKAAYDEAAAVFETYWRTVE